MEWKEVKEATVIDALQYLRTADALLGSGSGAQAREHLVRALLLLEDKKDVWKNPDGGIKELKEVL